MDAISRTTEAIVARALGRPDTRRVPSERASNSGSSVLSIRMCGNTSFLFTVHYVRITTLPCGQLDDFTTLIEMIPGPAIYCLRIHERSMAHNNGWLIGKELGR